MNLHSTSGHILRQFLFCSTLLALTGPPAYSTSLSATGLEVQDDTTLIALPLHTVEGRLDNGLHYLILPNATPAHTVEMRLVMRLGSVQETEQQKGCAHFLEHMAFVGTKHFPERSMIDYLESLGMKFGRDINALTGYDRTIFMLTVPMVKTDLTVLDSTLLVLRDWLTAIDFKTDRVQKERGVILEELRTWQNDDVFYDLKIGNSRFKDRMPLGSADDIRNVKRNQLTDFYRKWYSPRLASLVIVGDVDPAETEKRIQRLFRTLPARTVKDYQVYPLTYAPGVQLMEICDSIRRKSELEMILPHATQVGKDMSSVIQKERLRLTAYALDRRLTTQRLSCTASDNWYLANSNHFVLSFSADDKPALLKQVTRVAAEIRQLLNEGWTDEELDKIKRDFLETITLNENGRSSATYCDDFTDYILQGDRYIHTQEETDRLKQAILETDMQDLQKRLYNLLDSMKQQVLWTYRNHAGAQHHMTREEVMEAWQDGQTLQIPAFIFRHKDTEVQSLPTPACLLTRHPFDHKLIRSEKYLPDTRMTLVGLQNGIKLVFRPTAGADETILLNLFGKGGLANLNPELYHSYESTAAFMEMGGIARVPDDTLSNYMLQSGLLLNVSIGAYNHDLLGTAPAGRSQELFNLIDEKLHRPKLCYQDFEEVRQEELKDWGKETVLDQMMQRASDRLLVNRMDSLTGNSPSTWFRAKQRKDIETMNLDSMAAYFRGLYGQLDETTIVITGNYDLNKVKAQAIATFGRMKAVAPRKEWLSPSPTFRFPQKKYVEGFAHDHETQTVLEYVYPGKFTPSLKNGLILKLMRDLLQDRLLRVLREKENIVYSPYAFLYYYGAPQNSYYFNLSLSVDTGNSVKAGRLLHDIITGLQQQPVDVAELEKLKRGFLVNKQQTLTESAATDWRNIIASLVKNGESLEDFENYRQQLDSITPEVVRQAFRQYLSPDKSILLYLGRHPLYDQ